MLEQPAQAGRGPEINRAAGDGADPRTIIIVLTTLGLAVVALLALAVVALVSQAETVGTVVRRMFHITSPPPAVLVLPASRARVIGNPGDWFRTDDYPASARRAGIEGRVQVRLLIDPEGRVARCRVVSASASQDLDAVTCRSAMANGRFVPATDSRGRAIWSEYTPPAVRWRLQQVDGPRE